MQTIRPFCRSTLLLMAVALFGVFSQRAPAQTNETNKDCEQIRGDLKTLNDSIGQLVAESARLMEGFNNADMQIKKIDNFFADLTKDAPFWKGQDIRTRWLEAKRQWVLRRSSWKKEIDDNMLMIQATKDTIADLLDKLGDCGAKKSENTPAPMRSASPGPTVTSGGTPTIVASSINCDCANTEAPNIGGAAVRQCLKAEDILKAKAVAGQLKLEVVDGKIVGGDVCDYVTAGPAAWPVKGKPAQP